MPSIASGSNATGTFGVQDSVTVQAGSGFARFECPTGTIVSEFSGSRTFGPYDNQPYRITSLTGALYYEVADGTATNTVSASSDGVVTYVPSQGYRTVLFGDSMTDTYETVSVPTSVVYDSISGLTTVTNSGHQQATGWYVYLWSRSYTSTIQGWRVAVTVVSSSVFTVQLPPGLSGVPATWASALYRAESWRSAQAFVPWLQALSGQRFNIVKVGALSGDTTQNCLDRIQRDCLAWKPQVVIMQMPGINDTSAGNGNIKEDTIAANQQSIIDQILAAGARIILLTTTPVAASETAGRGTLTNMSRVQSLNARLKAYVQNKPGVVLFDAYRRIVDPADTTGLALTNYLRTTDKIHYSMRGGQFIASQLWTQISNAFPSDQSLLPTNAIDTYVASALSLTSVSRSGGVVTGTSNAHGVQVGERRKLTGGSESFNEFVTITAVTTNTLSFVTASGSDGSITGTIRLGRNNNIMPSPTAATATGGQAPAPITGTAALNYRVVAVSGTPTSAVASVVARSDGYGNNQRAVVQAAAAGDQVMITCDSTTYSTDLPAVVKTGRTYYFECMLSLTNVSGSNLSEIRVNLSMTVGGVVYQTYALNGYSEGAVLNSDIADYHIRTAPFVVPAGALTIVQPQVLVAFSASGTALTVDTGRWALREFE